MKLKIFITLVLLSNVSDVWSNVRILYTGTSMAAHTPCGCPGNPLGGMPRMANFIKEERIKDKKVLLFDAGNFAAVSGREKIVLTEYFMKGMKLLGYSAVLVGKGEIDLGIGNIVRMNKEIKLPLFSSNIVDSMGNCIFQETIKIKNGKIDIVVIGLSGRFYLGSADSAAGYKINDPLKVAGEIIPKVSGKNVMVVVVTDLKESQLENFLNKQNGVDLVIVSSDYAFRETPSLVNGAQVVSSFPETRNVGVIALDWENGKIRDINGMHEAMSTKYDGNKEMDAIFTAYEAALSTYKFKYPRPVDAQKLYAGASTCAECHRKETEKEKSGPHIKAFHILEKKESTYNPSCLKCHVTGYERENGFWDVETSMDMTGVQCEECHGPQMAHVREERKMAFGSIDFSGMSDNSKKRRNYKPYKVGFYKCAQCHTGKFKLQRTAEDVWKEIGH